MNKMLFTWLHLLVPALWGFQLIFPGSLILSIVDMFALFFFTKLMKEPYTGKTIHEKLSGYFLIILAIQCVGLLFVRKDFVLISSIVFAIAYFAEQKFCLFSKHWI